MTNTQMLVMAACIWLAPHTPKWLGFLNGCGMLIASAAIGLEWIK